MNNLLKPGRLAVDPNSPTIINLMSPSVYDYVEDCTDYNSVVAILEKLYVITSNEIFARHLLATIDVSSLLNPWMSFY